MSEKVAEWGALLALRDSVRAVKEAKKRKKEKKNQKQNTRNIKVRISKM